MSHPAVFTSNVESVCLAAGRHTLKMFPDSDGENWSIFDEVQAYTTKCAIFVGHPVDFPPKMSWPPLASPLTAGVATDYINSMLQKF